MNNFEDKLNRLEEINQKIKDRNISLEEAMGLFEEGVKLAEALDEQINQIEGKIEILVNGPSKKESPALELFPENDN